MFFLMQRKIEQGINVLLILRNISYFAEQIWKIKPVNWSSGNAFVSEAVGLRLKSRAGQIGHRVDTDVIFLPKDCIARMRIDAETDVPR